MMMGFLLTAALMLANPERGFRFEQMVGLEAGERPGRHIRDNWPVKRFAHEGVTVAQAYCYLMRYCDSDTIAQSKLDALQADFDRARRDGLKFLLRFAYEGSAYRKDRKAPTLERVLAHIRQLTPIVRKNTDVIYCLQIGWLGMWGEFHTNPLCYDESVRGRILAATLEMLPPERMTMMRRMDYKISALRALGDERELTEKTAFTQAPHARVGFFNDGTLAYHNDGGTFPSNGFSYGHNPEFARVSRESAFMPVDGELYWNEEPDPVSATGIRAIDRFARHHYTTFSLVHGYSELDYIPIKGSIDAWKVTPVTAEMLEAHGIAPDKWYFQEKAMPSAFEYIRDHLGYRLQLVSADSSRVVVRNTGFSRPINPRSAYFVRITADGKLTVAPTGFDCRRFTPGEGVTLVVPKTLSGKGQLALWMPDAAESLRLRPEYAVSMAGAQIKDVEGHRLNILSN